MNTFEDIKGPRLIVHGVERRNEVEGLRIRTFIEVTHIDRGELEVRETFRRRLGARKLDRVT